MEKINKNVEVLVKEIRAAYGNSGDLNTRVIKAGDINIGVFFMESSSATANISDFIMKGINFITSKESAFDDLYNALKNSIFNSQVITTKDFSQFPYFISSGFTIIVVDGNDEAIVMETRAALDRGVTESTSEPVVRGPKDSFTESHAKNLGLIRKRIKDSNLWFEEVKVGRRTQTRVSIAYINNVADKKNIKQIKDILNKIDVDGILDGGNLREYFLEEESFFPQILSTERPDLACQSLLNGKNCYSGGKLPFCLNIT